MSSHPGEGRDPGDSTPDRMLYFIEMMCHVVSEREPDDQTLFVSGITGRMLLLN
ncbi:MAG: hypothetical protein KZQ84_05860 [Candidatus Thiodiazotropha sp. (ex Lucinoma borealis)]|nr:hypothetical protein [Candidatus Thiodiazotropha sp. (ex Lucinoma borealis)]